MCQGNYPAPYLVISRLCNSHVLNRLDSFEEVAKALFGVQAQIPNASSIAYAIRMNYPQYAGYLETFENMRLIRLWGIRTTLHSYCLEDWHTVLSQISTEENWFVKKMNQRGIDVEALIGRATEIIADVDRFDRHYLLDGGIPEEFLGSWGDLLIELNNRGHICCLINDDTKRKEYKNIRKYFDGKDRGPFQITDSMRFEIALRYFNAYGPATLRDFAHWLGRPIRQVAPYMDLIHGELSEISCGGQTYYIPQKAYNSCYQAFRRFCRSTQCYLLPKFDPLLLAYADKRWIVEEKYKQHIWKTAGHVEGVVLQAWKAIGTWKYRLGKSKIDFHIELFEKNSPLNENSLRGRCGDVARFRGRRIGTITIE